MEKTLVKCKIVLEDDGKSLVTYMWKKTFLCFGYYYAFGCCSSNGKITDEKINRINDESVSKLIFDNFIKGIN